MIFTLNAELRHTVKKSDLTNLRASGMIPAVIYGNKMDSLSISLPKAEFTQMLKKSYAEVCFWEIEVEGKKYHTILKDKQIHPVVRNVLHLDFLTVSADSVVDIDVPITYLGEAIGLKEGGMMDIQMRTVKISCKANRIPDEISIDISNLNVGESVHVSNLPTSDWQYKDNADVTLAVVHAKKTEAPKEEAPAEVKE